jgi:hypothetical protein
VTALPQRYWLAPYLLGRFPGLSGIPSAKPDWTIT